MLALPTLHSLFPETTNFQAKCDAISMGSSPHNKVCAFTGTGIWTWDRLKLFLDLVRRNQQRKRQFFQHTKPLALTMAMEEGFTYLA